MTPSSPDTPHASPVEPLPAGLAADAPPVEPPSDLGNPSLSPAAGEQPADLDDTASGEDRKKLNVPWWLVVVGVFLVGLGWGYMLGAYHPTQPGASSPADVSLPTPPLPPSPPTATSSLAARLMDQINPPQGYTLTVSFGDLGPRLVAAGAIDAGRFAQVYQDAGQPLTSAQRDILTKGSQAPIVVSRANAYFLLNFFWAVGLANQNPVLTDGPMMARGKDQVGNFASTGGWTLGAKPATELFASVPLIALAAAQQARLVEVASAVYRPCCDNSTFFPDCNHGMAMLGLLELMAAHDTTADEMFAAAKYVNAFWFPQQAFELATFFQAQKQISFNQIDPRELVSRQYFSSSGLKAAHQWLATNGLLQPAPNQGGSCAVN
jgi:hypothetical protein